MSRAREVVARAAEARQAGRTAEARAAIEALLREEPGSPHAWNLLGVMQAEAGEVEASRASFAELARLDPKAPVVWLNLGRAHEAAGDHAAALAAFDEALAREAYFLPALLAKSRALAALGREAEALALTRSFLAGIPVDAAFPPAIQAQLGEARAFVAAHAERSADRYLAAIAEVEKAYPGADLGRARGYAEQRAGRRKIYQQQPTGGHFPFLPAIEYFDRAYFPWFAALEANTAAIRAELLALWAREDPAFRPYVAYHASAPVNQWGELNHSSRWSAWFLWEDGVRNDDHCARCPATTAALADVPLLDIPGKSPSVMFSVLQPRTRIPPHTGTTNARVTVHLPLVVPEGCGFRVGAETREWREGEAWAFDDTIEHEAWNDSNAPRALLILDVWNPLLSEAERAAVRLIG
ncbi:MAG TPA: aspartyl/asparaginyl beta-hydroxylase domain-containing protein [Allosphingosinicella sp.]